MSVTARVPIAASSKQKRIRRLLAAVEQLRERMLTAESEFAVRLAAIPASRRASARNLVHYLALRRQDLRPLQRGLAQSGLSSLGRCEAHVLASVDGLRAALHALSGMSGQLPVDRLPVNQITGPRTLARQADRVFGPSPDAREARIMVTLPGEAAADPALVGRLLAAGMDLARINCAHDDESVWRTLIDNVRKSAKKQGRTCPVLMDLGGPKLRTGQVGFGEAVLTWSPARDHLGRIVRPARVALVADGARPSQVVDAVLPLTGSLVSQAQLGDWVVCCDTRGKRRRMKVVCAAEQEVIVEANSTAYVLAGTSCQLERAGLALHTSEVAPLPPVELPLVLSVGDFLVVTADPRPGRRERRDAQGQVLEPAVVSCSLPEVLAQVRSGERVCFDDGKIDAVIESADASQMTVRITRARDGGSKLRSDKGINLPDSTLDMPCLTAQDLTDLAFARRHADLVGLSFVRRASDVHELVALLGAGERLPGVVLKIETPHAFEHLPDILLAALGPLPMGVMVARGDLAVEVGFTRLAEVQEQILWLCEAAHLPVIWGTQVLETLAKKGMATRAEVTDAAMSGRAECVMLNKGPHIVQAVAFLGDILTRMQDHQAKKRTLLRRLSVTKVLSANRKQTREKVTRTTTHKSRNLRSR